MRRLIPGLLALAVAAGFSVWAYPQLPAEVATHFDFQGVPNGWSTRLVAAIFVPALGLGMAGILVLVPRIDPRRANYTQFSPTYWTITSAVLLFLAVIHVLVLGKALGWNVDLGRVVAVGIGGIFLIMGNLMTRIRPNWFMGIRTPWTLSSDSVWRKTHRFGGLAFMLAGLCIVGSAFISAAWAIPGAVGLGVAAAIASVVYSYLLWKKEQNTVGGQATESSP